MTEEQYRAALPPAATERAERVARTYGVPLLACLRAEWDAGAVSDAGRQEEERWHAEAVRLGVNPDLYIQHRKANER